MTASFTGFDPRSGEPLSPSFEEAAVESIAAAAADAAAAFEELRSWTPRRRAALLRDVADRLDGDAAALVAIADRETALGARPRLEGEVLRTTNQLRAFARLLDDGWYVEAIIDPATATTPDLRRMLVPLGPVAVFGASNFPFAFGVVGGDTAAALAAGCPVVAKGHPSHPATSDLCASLVTAALDDAGAPRGTFALVQGTSVDVGRALVLAPEVRAVAFTGSLAGGRALADLAAGRRDPIPFYGEMGSTNPVFVLPDAAGGRADAIAAGYLSSMTTGHGQFCTKPGLLFVPDDPGGERVRAALAEGLGALRGAPLLNGAVHSAYLEGLEARRGLSGVEVREAPAAAGGAGYWAASALVSADLDTFLADHRLHGEHFGPAGVVVWCPPDRMVEAAESLEGSLAAAVHHGPGDDGALLARLHDALVERAGRVVHNGFPTGVAVVPAMHHGGPYPATTSPAHTSVGMTSIRRFLRPVAYQDAPDRLLPAALRDDNPLGILRLVDWDWTTAPVSRPAAAPPTPGRG